VATILRFIVALAEFEELAHQVEADADSLREGLFGARSYAECLIAERLGEPVGLALFFHNFSTFTGRPGLYLEDLFVLPEHRGAGVGQALLQALARIARGRGCRRMEWAVLDWNERAIAFYRKLGARPMAEWTVQRLGPDEIARLAGD
jgi:GNAT superfamily N-acetyltransferase